MVKPSTPDPEGANVVRFSSKISELIREAFEARALHPASVIGVLTYHANAVGATMQHTMMPPPPPNLLHMPPPGFKP